MINLTDEQIARRVKWVRALVSGEYAQGKGALKHRDNDGNYSYCCLGVARDVLGLTDYAVSYMPYDEELSSLGMSDGDQYLAAEWNDSRRKFDFARIADMIAYATASGVDFATADNREAPTDFAIEWLKQFNDK